MDDGEAQVRDQVLALLWTSGFAGVALHVSIPVNSYAELFALRLSCGTNDDPSTSRANL